MAINIVLLIASWLIPGLGFLVKRDLWRGLAIFLLVEVTFLLGMILHGTVLVPEFSYRSPGFNIVNLLMFFGELGNGGASILVMARDHFQDWLTRHGLMFLSSNEKHPWFDLATLYLLVSGAANYFAVSNFYDRYIGHRHATAESEEAK